MGSDKDMKEHYKLDKKRLKAQAKLEKARAKAAPVETTDDTNRSSPGAPQAPSPRAPYENMPWYKNPEWVRAIVAIASMLVAVIAIILTFYR